MDASTVLSDEDYDVVSSTGLSESSLADLALSGTLTREPPPTDAAAETYNTINLSPEDVQTYVRAAVDRNQARYPGEHKTVRVYVDGTFDGFSVSHAHQLRQAKLSFPSVYLLVGVFADDVRGEHGARTVRPHVERCEVARHCRWVDEIVADAPWELDDRFVATRRIDFVAVDEGASVDPEYGKARVRGYDVLKRMGRVIPMRRTTGIPPLPLGPMLVPLPGTPPSGTIRAVPSNAPTITGVDWEAALSPAMHEQVDVYGIGI